MAGLVERRVAATRAVATTGVEARGAEAQVPSLRKAWAAPLAPRDASVEWEGGRGCHANGKVHKVRACSPPSSELTIYPLGLPSDRGRARRTRVSAAHARASGRVVRSVRVVEARRGPKKGIRAPDIGEKTRRPPVT